MSLIWSPDPFALPFMVKLPRPINHIFLYPFLPVHAWSPGIQETFLETWNMVLCDLSSLHEFAYCILPNSYLSGLIYFKEVSVPVEARTSSTAMVSDLSNTVWTLWSNIGR
jgi:hypothetical protein